MIYIRMIRCPICSGPLNFLIYFYKAGDTLRFNTQFAKYDRKCKKCNLAFMTYFFNYGGKESIERTIKYAKSNRDITQVHTQTKAFCEIQQIDEYLTLTPYQERKAFDTPFETSLPIPEDFHDEFMTYRKKFYNEKVGAE